MMLFNGANIAEKMEISANGERVRFTRDIASITMDLNDVESIVAKTAGGVDSLLVGDLGGTDVVDVVADIAAIGGGDDLAADTVTANGTNGDDVVSVIGAGPTAAVSGLAASVTVSGTVAGSDRVYGQRAGRR